MSDLKYYSFEMEGKKSAFANWILDISPEETPFVSMIQKEQIKNTVFEWQNDKLAPPEENNFHKQASDPEAVDLEPTSTFYNRTQLFRKVIDVSDTAEAVDAYGRGSELEYQMGKACREMKRDIESTLLLANQDAVDASSSTASTTESFGHFVEPAYRRDVALSLLSEALFDLLHSLYIEGGEPSVIMYHPVAAKQISLLQERADKAKRWFKNVKDVDFEVNQIRDPLGQNLSCIVNRFIPENQVYIFNPNNIRLMVLRGPETSLLGKTGSSTKYLIEQELGLQVKNTDGIAAITLTDIPAA